MSGSGGGATVLGGASDGSQPQPARAARAISSQRRVGNTQWQGDHESRATGGRTLGSHAELAAVLDRDLARDGEAEAGAGGLGGDVGLEDLLAVVGGDALAVVVDRDGDVIAALGPADHD